MDVSKGWRLVKDVAEWYQRTEVSKARRSV